MGCCQSSTRAGDGERRDDGEGLVGFYYSPRHGTIVPVKPGHSCATSKQQHARSTERLSKSVEAADLLVKKKPACDDRSLDLQELEQVKRCEILSAYLVTSKMLQMARKKMYPGSGHGATRHSDPVEDESRLVIQHASISTQPQQLLTQQAEADDICIAPYSPSASAEMPNKALPIVTELVPRQVNVIADRAREVGLSGAVIQKGMKSKCRAMGNAWDFLAIEDAGEHLTKGNSYFGFLCKTGAKLGEHDTVQFETIANLTGFEDELRDNGAPRLDARDLTEMAKYTVIMVKAMYVLPGFDLSNMTRTVMASLEYQRSCQPGNPKFWDDCTEPWTFRETKPLIRFVYSLVIQLRVHEITDLATLQSFRTLDGMVPEKAMLLERTKRDKNKADSTLKCKSLLLYYRIPGGTLVTNATVVVNTSIPGVVAALVNNFGSSGAAEVGDTAVMTREYLLQKFGDCRIAA
jgi:hypothetical protein